MLTGHHFKPDSYLAIRDVEGELSGISVTYNSNNTCARGDDGNTIDYTFTSVIMCNPNITAQGQAEWVTGSDDGCNVSVTLMHSAGCHIYTAPWIIRFLEREPWVQATAMIVLGAFIAFKGRPLFRTLAPILIGIKTFGFVYWAATVLNLLTSTTLVIGMSLLAVILAIAVPFIIQKDFKVLQVIFMAFATASVGSYLFEMVLAIWNVKHWLAYEGSIFVFALIGAGIALTWDYTILFGSAFIGSYMFMRGFSYLFKGYPSEVKIDIMLRSEEPVDLEYFWYYMIVLVIMFAVSARYQYVKAEAEPEEKDDNFNEV